MRLTPVLKELKKRIAEEHVFDMSAQLAYYILMSIFPFLLLAVTVLGFLPFTSSDILAMIQPYAPPSTYELLESNLAVILDERREGVLSLSLVITIYLASVVFQSIIRIMDNAYRVHKERPFWMQVLLGIFLMFGLLGALVISLMLPIFGKVLGQYAFRMFGLTAWFYEVWTWIRWVLSSLVIFMVFLCLYKFTPNTHVTFGQALPGALFAMAGWQASSLAFSFYVSLNNYSLVYGNLGGIIVLVGWFYLSSMVLILGGLLNAAICKTKEQIES
ncbi:ribonuclease [Laceyella sacchari]|jgi:membrane protein|uniref:Membrane protein n=1 Tax=Laceyella tengchongensis TaxID=574699 RepID=A0AA46ACK8_9BACL|nr:YihY/virulence factor BrkB family protein [Laceyella tengchongensis]AUS07820.1 ribonuclease [Laceyella sacchari]MRG27168.1 YihY family inner membrane protein [Laceyella tengchongensis]SMP00246.1 membrane protein [Laceyella tengchongensis]